MHKPAPSEVPSLRTTYSDTYDNHDGTFTSSISAAPINYQPSAGAAFAPIDLTFSAISGGNGRVRAGKTVMPVELGAPDDAAGFMSLDTGSGKISLRLAPGTKAGIAGSRPSSKGPVSSVSGLMAGMDLSVSAGRSGVRTFFTLKSKPASNSFTLALDAGKLNPVFNADGSISFLDAKGNAVATMPHPYAVDSSYDEHLGSGQMTSDVGYSLSTQGSTALLTVTVDAAWLASAVYPVYVDPTFNSSDATTTDNFVSSKYPTTAYPSYQRPDSPGYWELWLGRDPTPGTTYLQNDFIKFNLSSIPTSTISSASLQIFPYWQYEHTTAMNTWVNTADASWATGSLTWNNQPDFTAYTTGATTEGDWHSFNVADKYVNPAVLVYIVAG